jgi:hypothetical protein
LPKTTKEGDPDKDFFLKNRLYMFQSNISQKYLKRESLVTFFPNKKRNNSNGIIRILDTFLPKNTKPLRPGFNIFYFLWRDSYWTISRKKTGKKYWLVSFWQKLIKQSIFMHILPNKTFFCQKQPRKVTPTKIFFYITERTCSNLISVKNI